MPKTNLTEINQLKILIEQQKSEIFQLKEIIQNLPGSIYWKNKHGVYLGINKTSSESMQKFSFPHAPEEIIGKSDHDLFPKDMADGFRNHDHFIMENNKEFTQEEEALLQNGVKITQLSTKKPLHDQYGNVVGLVGNTVDITYLKKIEIELRNAKEKAEQANALKIDFIKNMEHDIRTPFSGILGLATILCNKEVDPDKKSFLSDIAASTKELLDYCNSIIDFSKIEMGTLPILSKKIKLKKLIDSVIAIETPAASYKNLELFLKYDERLPTIIIGDDHRLLRILLNLIGNAIKFTKKGYISLSIKLGKLEQNNHDIIIKFTIEDTGIGISQDKQDFIFEKFSKGNLSNNNYYKGLGLGLPVAKKFTEELGGEIDVKSEVDKGTTFICTIPFKLPLIEDDTLD